MAMSIKVSSRLRWLVCGLCIFIAFLNFKPSEPYLSQYLICDYDTRVDECNDHHDKSTCEKKPPCVWSPKDSTCSVVPCSDVPLKQCGNDDFDYCESKNSSCQDINCYESFSEDEVNDEIYPWSTYAYLPFLLFLGPFAELFSYRVAILLGICGRIVTRFLLLFGKSLLSMQLMQIAYALGTAAEDVLSAYIYYVVPSSYYQQATSYVKTAALTSCVVSGVLGDVLVVVFDTSLTVLMWISAAAVGAGLLVGLMVIRRSNKRSRNAKGKKGKGRRGVTAAAVAAAPSGQKRSVRRRSAASSSSAPDSHAAGKSWLVFLGLTSSEGAGQKTKASSFSSTSTFAHSYSRARHHSAGGQSDVDGDIGEEPGEDGVWDEEEGEEEEEEDEEGEDSNVIAAFRNALLNTGAGGGGGGGTVESPKKGTAEGIARTTVKVFRKQMTYLSGALKSTPLVMLLLMWIVGNAAYSILYNYEVSIYEELHGSNEWNGCVLAVMLLVGSVGAMTPAWLAHDKTANRNEDVIAKSRPVSDALLAARVTAACVLSCAALVLFALFWETVPSVGCLAVFFGTWQYVNVTTFARLALRLKESQQAAQREAAMATAHSRDGSLVESLLQQAESPLSGAAGDLSKHQTLSLGAGSHSSGGNFSKFSQYDVVAVSDAVHSQQQHQPTSEYIRSRTIDMQAAKEQVGDLSPLSEDPSGGAAGAGAASPLLPPSGGGEAAAEPPYSIAIVSIIALCVLVQIVIQLVVFTILELSLKTACLVVILIFVVMSFVYFVSAVLLNLNQSSASDDARIE